jgi:hypothetical protein
MIDLETAKPDDEYLSRHGKILTYLARNERNKALPYVLVTASGHPESYTSSGQFHSNGLHSNMDLVSRKQDN